MIIAGEASGDMHGAALIKELKAIDQNLFFFGIGGNEMIAEGMEALYNIKEMAFLGFTEVLKHLPFIKKVQKELIQLIKEKKIKEIILIDYPGFNLNFAKKIKRFGVKITYYISPQIWAWRKNRIKKIKKLVNRMIVVFPFEEKFYSDYKVEVNYVGHPLIDKINNYNFLSKEDLYKTNSLELDKDILLIMPGSRLHEIENIFPKCIAGADKLAKEFNFQIVVACAENLNESYFYKFRAKYEFQVVKGNTYNLIKYAKFGIIKSGTSTIEASIINTPFIVVYVTNRITYLIGKMLIKISNIAMPNIIAGKNIVNELIQKDVNAENIYRISKTILLNQDRYNLLKEGLKLVREKLGSGGASKKAAKLIYLDLNEA